MSMYNKIFTKILDSSVWLEATPTRIVWITLIAAMDENGFCPFAAVGNVASRAHVTHEEAQIALEKLESPDFESSDPDNEGRRIERVPGGWIVLNAPKYRALVTRVNIQEKVKERVRRYRERKRTGNAPVTGGNENVTESESRADTETDSTTKKHRAKAQELAAGNDLSPEMVARGLAERLGLSLGYGPASFNTAVSEVARAEMNAGKDAEALTDEMEAAYRFYEQEKPNLEIHYGPAKFFGDGHWRNRDGWKYKRGKAKWRATEDDDDEQGA